MAGLIEFPKAKDIYCSGVQRIETLEENVMRLHLYVIKNGEQRPLPVAIVMPIRAVPDVVIQAIRALARDTDEIDKLLAGQPQ